jgi:hypothetical protein
MEMLSENSNSNFYVRYRARITGPYDMSELARMVRRGTLGRAHEVSRDRVQWVPAGGIPGLFGGNAPGTADVPLDMPPAPQADAGGMYYLSGETPVGPMPPEVLETMAREGKFLPDTVVWATGDPNSCAASAHPLLSQVQWPKAAAVDPNAGRKQRAGPGCGLMLTAGAVVLLALGVWAAIWLSSDKKSGPDSKTAPPSSLPTGGEGAMPDRTKQGGSN